MEEVHEEGLQAVLAVMPEHQRLAALLARDAVEMAAPQPRAERAVGRARRHLLRHDRIGVAILDPVRDAVRGRGSPAGRAWESSAGPGRDCRRGDRPAAGRAISGRAAAPAARRNPCRRRCRRASARPAAPWRWPRSSRAPAAAAACAASGSETESGAAAQQRMRAAGSPSSRSAASDGIRADVVEHGGLFRAVASALQESGGEDKVPGGETAGAEKRERPHEAAFRSNRTGRILSASRTRRRGSVPSARRRARRRGPGRARRSRPSWRDRPRCSRARRARRAASPR